LPLSRDHPFGEDAFIMQESDLVTERGICAAMSKALQLCLDTNLNWIVRRVSEALFDMLERARGLATLKILSWKMGSLSQIGGAKSSMIDSNCVIMLTAVGHFAFDHSISWPSPIEFCETNPATEWSHHNRQFHGDEVIQLTDHS
jgi:hypothetical protein